MAEGQIVRVDNLPVAVGTANAFYKLKRLFEEAFPGITLHVYSGYRSYADQEKIFRERYVTAGNINGRRVYDVRRWNGQLWYRISGAGTVAAPGTSNHGDGRALDIRDSGSDPGVTRYNNARSAWIYANAWRAGFDPDGYRDFNEPWHIRFTGNQWAGSAPSQGGSGGTVSSGKKGNVMEAYVVAPNGTVVHLYSGGKHNFKNPDEYNHVRSTILSLRKRGATNLIAPPSLKKVPKVSWTQFERLANNIGAPTS